MKKNLSLLLVTCLIPLLFTACPKRKPLPTPQDTAVSRFGGTAGGVGGADSRINDSSTFTGELEGGLLPRSDIEAFNSGAIAPKGFFDKNGSPIKAYDQFGNEISPDDVFDSSIRSYDENGNSITVYDAYGNPLNAYDSTGNPITVYDANGNPTTPYDENGNLRTLFDENGNPVTAYDKNGSALAAVNANYSPVSSDSSAPYDSSQVIGQIYFGYDQYFISPEARQSLTDVQDFLADNPSAKVLLVGHCSWHGTSDYNLLLGDKRANTVFDYLTNLGVSSSRMETLSRGSLDATEGASKADSSQDRRVDVVKVN